MTRTARYNTKTNTFRELPGLIKPVWEVTHWNYDDYGSALVAYDAHVAALRTIPCHESCKEVFKDQGVYEEGKGYELKKWCQDPDMCSISSCDCKEFACPVPARSEDELWNDVFLAMHKKAQGYKIISGINHPGLPNHKPWHDEMIAELKKHYTLTPALTRLPAGQPGGGGN